jgi:hypothetical protein
MISYKELLQQTIRVMQNIISQTFDELHTLVQQLCNDISKNNRKLVERLMEEHERRAEAHMNEKWMKNRVGVGVRLLGITSISYGHPQVDGLIGK